MLRKQTRDFLMNWPQKESKNPKVQEFRRKYETRNPAQIYKRAVKYTNDIFDDLHYLIQHLPEEYLNQVNIEKGLRYLHLEENQTPQAGNAKLRIALAQTTAGLHTIRQILREDPLLDNLYKSKFFEIEFIANLLYEIATGKLMDKKYSNERNRKLTKIFSEYNVKSIL